MALAVLWAAGFGYLAVVRHLAGGSHAEDLGFTDQVLSNFLRGQWFRMSIYQGATWNTELDVASIARPDSLLAFHFEPMLLLLVPLYALGGGATLLLVLQAIAVAAGALPAFRLGLFASGSTVAGLVVALAYLLSPLGQWAVLADFHTSTMAAPLLLLAVERLVVKKSATQALLAAGLAATAREDVGLVVAAFGVVFLMQRTQVRAGLALLGLGLGCTTAAMLVIRAYSGGVSPFDTRYTATLGEGFQTTLAALVRPSDLSYARTLGLSGAWLGLLAPLSLLPALPSLASNMLSMSPWMMAGKAHYSALVLPFIGVGAAFGLQRLGNRPILIRMACAGLMISSVSGYAMEGAGPLGGNYAPASVTDHAVHAAALAYGLPPEASVSASSSLVPRVSRRAHVYVFPAVLDADYVFLDLEASPAPTSAGDVFLHVRSLLSDGGWRVDTADDGLVLLRRDPDAQPTDIDDLTNVFSQSSAGKSVSTDVSAELSLLSATLVPSPEGSVEVDGPRSILRTVWRTAQPLPKGTHVEFLIDRDDGQQTRMWDVGALWWNPPDRWTPDQAVTVDISDVPMRQFISWQAVWSGR